MEGVTGGARRGPDSFLWFFGGCRFGWGARWARVPRGTRQRLASRRPSAAPVGSTGPVQPSLPVPRGTRPPSFRRRGHSLALNRAPDGFTWNAPLAGVPGAFRPSPFPEGPVPASLFHVERADRLPDPSCAVVPWVGRPGACSTWNVRTHRLASSQCLSASPRPEPGAGPVGICFTWNVLPPRADGRDTRRGPHVLHRAPFRSLRCHVPRGTHCPSAQPLLAAAFITPAGGCPVRERGASRMARQSRATECIASARRQRAPAVSGEPAAASGRRACGGACHQRLKAGAARVPYKPVRQSDRFGQATPGPTFPGRRT